MNLKRNILFISVILLIPTLSLAATKSSMSIHPIVDVRSGIFFGGSVNGKWVKDQKMKPLIKGGETYRLYSQTRYIGKAIGGKVYDCNEYGFGGVKMKDLSLPKILKNGSEKFREPITGICGNWNALPRVPKVEQTAQKKYQQVIRNILKAHGVTNAVVNITKVMSIDLEGDGNKEVIIAASTKDKDFPRYGAKKNDYSMVIVRRMIRGKISVIPLEENIYSRNVDNAFPSLFTLESVLDVNGDGVMEVIIGRKFLEGYGKSIIQVKRGKSKRVLDCGWNSRDK